MTSAIARMNLFLHGIEDFQIERGDTLSDPKFIEGDRLRRFDVVLANPPYSIKPVGPHALQLPTPGGATSGARRRRAAPTTPSSSTSPGLDEARDRALRDPLPARRPLPQRGARDARASSSRATCSSASSGSGRASSTTARWRPASSSAARARPTSAQGKVLFINAVNEFAREQAQSFLREPHIEKILDAYRRFEDIPGFARVASLDEIAGERRQPQHPALRRAERRPRRRRERGDLARGGDRRVGRGQPRDPRGSAEGHRAPPRGGRAMSSRRRLAARAVRRRRAPSQGDGADPESSGLERYVAGEHMDTDELQITRWGTIGDGYLGPAFHRRSGAARCSTGRGGRTCARSRWPTSMGSVANTTFVCETKDRACSCRSSCRSSCRPSRSTRTRSLSRRARSTRTSTGQTSRGTSSTCRRSTSSARSPSCSGRDSSEHRRRGRAALSAASRLRRRDALCEHRRRVRSVRRRSVCDVLRVDVRRRSVVDVCDVR